MAALVPSGGNGLIIEVGAGTGSVTQAMLQQGIVPERMLVLERSPVFCRVLRKKFPQLNIVQGDAAQLASYVPKGLRVDAVVSSLPLMSLPHAVRTAVIEQIRILLHPGSCVVQFTYALWARSPFRRAGYTCDCRRIIFRNMPPARLERFTLARGF
jgi:phospholipid N-methyltransferase